MPSASSETLSASERELGRQLATLSLAGIKPSPTGSAVQAAAWWNALARLGIRVPLMAVHDLGSLLVRHGERARLASEPRVPDGPATGYQKLLQEVAQAEALAEMGSAPLRDEVVAVLLARLLVDAHREWTAGSGSLSGPPALPLVSPLYGWPMSDLRQRWDPRWVEPFLAHLVRGQTGLLARLEHIDLGPLRLLSLLSSQAALPSLPELYRLVTLPTGTSAAEFCLDLLPSLLETKCRHASQCFSVDGYASIERRGNVDALLPSELAHDSEAFALRASSEELLYYAHERPQDERRLAHGILVDASASMRGAREVFARGFALALSKKLALMGASVWLRFFDNRLHQRVAGASLGGDSLPYVIGFRSERGRNYARVFDDLLAELRDDPERGRQDLSLTIITHAHCHVSRATVAALARMSTLRAVFVLPTSALSLDYLSLLHGHHIVTPQDWARPSDRKRRALVILSSVAGEETGP